MRKILLFIAVAAMALTACKNAENVEGSATISSLDELEQNPVEGQWYKIEPEGALSSDGSQWKGLFRKGSENRLMIVFCGGGVSVDEYTAARGFSKSPKEMYYFDNIEMNDLNAIDVMSVSFAKQCDDNPFKDWSIVFLPYSTGDFHCGTADFEYTGLDGEKHVLYHHGYTNYRMAMDRIIPVVGTPEAIVVTGFSAGGFGTSILSEDIAGLFPDTKNFVACVDASCLVKADWADVAANVWGAPQEICDRIVSDNISLDCLKALHRDKPYVKILYGCSANDEVLARFQTYFDTGVRRATDKEAVVTFHEYLKNMCEELQNTNPEVGLFIWNDILLDEETGATEHTTEFSENFHMNHNGYGSFAQWISDAVEGEVFVYGLEFL